MWQFIVERGLGIAGGFLAMGAQLSGYTNLAIALGCIAAAAFFLVAPLCYHLHAWHKMRRETGRRSVEPDHLIVVGLVGVILFAALALGGVLWRGHTSKPILADAIKLSPEARKPGTPKLSDFEWGFEKFAYYTFIGMSADPEKRILVHFFQAQGFNRTNDPIEKVHSFVRSDRTGKQYPVYFNLAGTTASETEINPIPVGAIIDIRAPFLPDGALMPVQEFLNDVVPFTFFFEYDGKVYRRSFSLTEIEPLIARYEQEVRKSAVKPPQMSKRDVFK